jgi:hypothetical protein
MSDIEKFEKAIIEFGVKEALEYFGTPPELWYQFDGLILKEKEILGLEAK